MDPATVDGVGVLRPVVEAREGDAPGVLVDVVAQQEVSAAPRADEVHPDAVRVVQHLAVGEHAVVAAGERDHRVAAAGGVQPGGRVQPEVLGARRAAGDPHQDVDRRGVRREPDQGPVVPVDGTENGVTGQRDRSVDRMGPRPQERRLVPCGQTGVDGREVRRRVAGRCQRAAVDLCVRLADEQHLRRQGHRGDQDR
ncbi:hypothetical protein [Actinophytocola sp.]|uniref:hypothetical protein n=1 Tax=Actinophytocola sp. TaxID=1872138 RepID=UPI003D6B7AEA